MKGVAIVKNDIDVLIVGAGPVGLLAAYALTIRGIKVRLIEQRQVSEIDKTQARAITLSCRALEVLEALELKESFMRSSQVCRGHTSFVSEELINDSDFGTLDKLQTEVPYFLHLPQWKMQEIIIAALQDAGVSIEWGTTFQRVNISDQQANVTVLKNAHEEEFTCDYLLACDGANSTVRKEIGIKIALGFEPLVTFRLVDAKISTFPHDISKRYFYFLKDKILFILPIYKGYQRIVTFQQSKTKTLEMGIDYFKDVLNECGFSRANIIDPLWFSEFKPISGLAEKFQEGRVFFLGDAAHPISPITGQGVNTGFQDAYNLCWKLALVQHKKAHKDLLTSYHNERHFAAKQLVDRAARLSDLLCNFLKGGIPRFLVKRQLKSKGFFANYLHEQSQLGICYSSSGILQNSEEAKNKNLSNLLPGMRFPDFDVCTAIGREGIYKYTAYDRYLLVIFSGGEAFPIIQKIQELKSLADKKYPELL